MTNFEKIKNSLCSTINSMTEEQLFEFISDYEDNNRIFPDGATFSCNKCRKTYGDCGTHTLAPATYKRCQERFYDYCKKES